MSSVSISSAHVALELAGFLKGSRPNLFLVDDKKPVTPAYYCTIIRRRGKIGFSGGIGIYFQEFERLWTKFLSIEERRSDITLPLIMMIENYVELIDGGVFSLTDNFDDLLNHATQIYIICQKLPGSLEDFDRALIRESILDKRVSDYLHIFDYLEDDNLYLRKSVSFVHWFASAWPGRAQDMYQCLADSQRRRLRSG